jgi:hypothetical protein
MLRGIAVLVALVGSVPAFAGEMSAEQARHFVMGKLFAYSCFEGTKGAGRIQPDGSVIGTIQIQGNGPTRMAALPAGTIKVKGDRVCASVRGVPVEPCFNLQQTSEQSFRGTISGLGFAYCDFTRRGGRVNLASNRRPLSLEANANAAE